MQKSATKHQQNKFNSTLKSTKSRRIYPRDARMVQYTQINKYNTQY
jgi:hypothetical protein